MKESLRVQIETAAKANGVSLNAELVARLEQSFRDDRVLAALKRIENKLSDSPWSGGALARPPKPLVVKPDVNGEHP